MMSEEKIYYSLMFVTAVLIIHYILQAISLIGGIVNG